MTQVNTCKSCEQELGIERVYFGHQVDMNLDLDTYCSMACFLRDRKLKDIGVENEL